MITQKDNLLIQSYISCALIAELGNNRFLDSDFFSKMTFGIPEIKETLHQIGLDNQGFALMTLYAMLVIPRQLIGDVYPNEYQAIQDFLTANCKSTTTNYSSDSTTIDYLRHIRNATAHASVSFRPTDVICFRDEDPRTSAKFSTELPLKHLGELIHNLQTIHLLHIQLLQNSTP